MSGSGHRKMDTRRQDLRPNLEKLGLSSRSGLLTSSCLTGNLTSSILLENRYKDSSRKSEHLKSHSEAQRKDSEKRIRELRDSLRDTTERTALRSSRLTSPVKLSSSGFQHKTRTISPPRTGNDTRRQDIRTKSKLRLENEGTSSNVLSSYGTSGLSHGGSRLTQTLGTSSKLGGFSRQSHIHSSYGTTQKSPPSPPKKSRVAVVETERYDVYCDIEQPEYHLQLDHDSKEFNIDEHIPLNQEQSIGTIQKPIHDIMSVKNKFINAVSGSLIKQPDYKDNLNPARKDLLHMAEVVVNYDAEFVLKVALYTRKELNIRTTGNFLLAFAAKAKECRPYLKRYYSATIALPSDWIDVAEMYQAFGDKHINFGSLPSSLRRVMTAKFIAFDKYQLAKYNKESSQKKKKKKEKQKEDRIDGDRSPEYDSSFGYRGRGRRASPLGYRGRGRPAEWPRLGRRRASWSSEEEEMESEEEDPELLRQQSYGDQSETEEEIEKKTFTLKQLIRKLHIVEPPEHVLCLIGKKYPATLDEFYQSRLPGVFDETKAGTRMKLPVPETWETQVSLKGNKAATWESLIDHKKLPFMAMLRNLRNVIQAGISEKHHQWILKKLNDEGAVIYSKQFPFRFFSAYHALGELQKQYEHTQLMLQQGIDPSSMMASRGRGGFGGRGRGGRGRGRGGRGRGRGGRSGDSTVKETLYDTRIIDRYRKALDNAVKIATVHNVKPIKGTTIIFCNVGCSMDSSCTAAKGLGKPRTLAEIAVLLGLMCKYSCEECKMIVYGDESREVELEKGTILDNMESVLSLRSILAEEETIFPDGILKDLLVERKQIDNLIVLSDGMSMDSQEGTAVTNFLKLYRRMVNQNLLFVNVNLATKDSGFSQQVEASHDNDIFISGYSDQILRFIAERGDAGQLFHVEKIDEAYDLKKIAVTAGEKVDAKPQIKVSPEKPLPIALLPQWRTVRVFISSTFRDMHGERDLLTRYVFPELRARAKKHFINVYEVDLRWGVTEEDTRSHRALEMCLSEVQKSQYFVGVLGERYGWRPQAEDLPKIEGFDHKDNSSVTELEMMAFTGPNNKMTDKQERAFFYIRDNEYERDLPKKFAIDFESEDSVAEERLEKLKTTLKRSGYEVYDKYPCKWGGVVGNKPVVVGLEHFGTRVLNNLWNAIQKHYPDEDVWLDEFSHLNARHEAFKESKVETFVGRKKLITQCMNTIQDMEMGLLVLHGTQGSGKSALMASLVRDYVQSPLCDTGLNVLSHFMGATPGSTNIVAVLRRICHELNARFNLGQTLPENYKNLVLKFEEMLKQAASRTCSPLTIVIDGLDQLDNTNEARLLDWIPEELPKNILVVVSVQENTACYQALKRRPATTFIPVGTLDILDKAEVVRKILSNYGKSLEESPFNNQMKLLVAKKQASLPLFLSLACEELRVFGVFEDMTAKLRSIPHTVPLLLHDIMIRLEEDHGKSLVSAALSLLVCSRNGLTKEELHELLSLFNVLGSNKLSVEDILRYELVPNDRIPAANFSQLIRAIQGFLLPMGETSSERLSIAHEHIELAIKQRYLKSATLDQENTLHKLLAGYYLKEADEWNDGTWQGVNVKAFSELPYHLLCCKSFDKLKDVLCSLNFINKKCILGMAPNLLEDFLQEAGNQKSTDRERAKFLSQEKVQQYQSFVSRNVHVLKSSPTLTFQQAYNEPKDTTPALDARELLAQGMKLGSSLIEWVNKPQKADSCQLSITGLSEVVTCIAIAPDCNTFACGSQDCTVKMYDIGTGKELRSFTGHTGAITDLCFAGNDRLCTASTETDLCLWDAKQGHRVAIMKGHRKRVNACVADPDGKMIVSAGWDCGLKVWNARDGKLDSDLKGNQKPLNCISFHPEGQMVVTGGWDATLKIWDTFNRNRIAVLRGHLTSVRDVAYNPRGSHIASASLDGEVKLWSAAQGTQVGTFTGHALPINRLTFTPSGQELITVSDDQKAKIWSGYMGKLVHSIEEESGESAKCVALSPEGDCVAVGYYGGTVRVFDIVSGIMEYKVKPHNGPVTCIRFSPNGKQIVTGSQDASLKILVADTGHKTHTLQGHSNGVLSVAFGTKYIVSTSEDFTCIVYKVSALKDRCAPTYILRGHDAFVTGCSFDSEEKRLATSGRDDIINIWDLTKLSPSHPSKNTPIKVLRGCHSDWINGISWSNTGDFVVSGSNDFNLKLWDLKANKSKMDFRGHTSTVSTVEYKYGCIVSGSTDGEVKVWSHKGNEITTLHGHKERVNSCDIYVKVHIKEEQETESTDWAALVDDEEWKEQHKMSALDKKNVRVLDVIVASCSDDGTVNIWQPCEGTEIACLDGHSDRVTSVAASANGTICTGSLDKTIKVWKPQLSEEVVPQSHNAEVTSVVYSPTGQYVLSASRDGIVKVWNHEKDSPPACIYEYRAHDKAVNTISFVGVNDEIFATGSDDKLIKIWKLIKTKKGLRVKRSKTIKNKDPITSMVWLQQSRLLVADIGGKVQELDADSTKHGHTKQYGNEWFLCVDGSPNGMFCAGSASNKIKLWTSSKAKEIEIPYEYDPEIPVRKRQENWVTAVCANKGNFSLPCIVGDVFGQLSLVFKAEFKMTHNFKAHGARITGCDFDDNLNVVYSVSEDKTVKIWHGGEETPKQIGQFQGPGCMSCFTRHPHVKKARNGCMQSIVCGDKKGNINFLECRLPISK